MRTAELEFFPRITLQPSVGASLVRGAVDATTGFWSLGLGLVVPILDRPRLMAALDATSARGQQAVIAYERAVQTAFSEADQALRRLEADRGRVELLVGDALAVLDDALLDARLAEVPRPPPAGDVHPAPPGTG